MLNLKPGYHLRPQKNWINDPNGPIFWKGEYHIFYQYNPAGPLWGNIHWGHAVSPDMLRWTNLEPALRPGPEEYDSGGIFSGGSIIKDGRLHLFYTGAIPQSQCLALSAGGDNETEFLKYSGNPVIPTPPPGYDTLEFRDPFVWEEDGGFHMVVASSYQGRGIVFLYSSVDLFAWTFEGELYSVPLLPGVPAFECPLFFRLDGKDVLVVSPFDIPFYVSGKRRGTGLTVERRGIFDYSRHWYAPNTFLTPDGRRIIIGWLREERAERHLIEAGWAGCLSVPRELFSLPSGQIGVRPVEEMANIRQKTEHFTAGRIAPDRTVLCIRDAVQGELSLSLRREPGSVTELLLFCDNESGKGLSCIFDDTSLTLDSSRLSVQEDAKPEEKKVPLDYGWTKADLRIFIDRSVVEVFINEVSAISTRTYPDSPGNSGIAIKAIRGNSAVIKAVYYHMNSAILP